MVECECRYLQCECRYSCEADQEDLGKSLDLGIALMLLHQAGNQEASLLEKLRLPGSVWIRRVNSCSFLQSAIVQNLKYILFHSKLPLSTQQLSVPILGSKIPGEFCTSYNESVDVYCGTFTFKEVQVVGK